MAPTTRPAVLATGVITPISRSKWEFRAGPKSGESNARGHHLGTASGVWPKGSKARILHRRHQRGHHLDRIAAFGGMKESGTSAAKARNTASRNSSRSDTSGSAASTSEVATAYRRNGETAALYLQNAVNSRISARKHRGPVAHLRSSSRSLLWTPALRVVQRKTLNHISERLIKCTEQPVFRDNWAETTRMVRPRQTCIAPLRR
jgi:hypothetical protein